MDGVGQNLRVDGSMSGQYVTKQCRDGRFSRTAGDADEGRLAFRAGTPRPVDTDAPPQAFESFTQFRLHRAKNLRPWKKPRPHNLKSSRSPRHGQAGDFA